MKHSSCIARAVCLSVALASCFCAATARAQSGRCRSAHFGLNYSPLGNATVAASGGTGVVVGNLGSAGQDGVSIDVSGAEQHAEFLFRDVHGLPATIPNGAVMEQQGYGSLGGGTNQLLDSAVLTVVNSATSQLTMDVSPIWNGQPTTLNFYSGGINGTLVYSEAESGPTVDLTLPTLALSGTWVWSQDGDLPGDTIDSRWKPGLDASITTPGGIVLPAADAIDLIDFGATSTAPVQRLSVAITAGEGIGSFETSASKSSCPNRARWLSRWRERPRWF